MTMAVTDALARGQKAVLCASTGNTSASAAAYAAARGHDLRGAGAAGQDRDGQARPGGHARRQDHPGRGQLRRLPELARKTTAEFPTIGLVNSVNPVRIEGQKTAAFEICDALGKAPDIHALPVGNAGNITAYWRGYSEYYADGITSVRPRMLGVQAAGAAPLVHGAPVKDPETIATAIRIGSPASWDGAVAAKEESGGAFRAATDEEILEAYRLIAAHRGRVRRAGVGGVAWPACSPRARRAGWTPG